MNGLLYINKPKDMTSFDVVAKIRKAYQTKSVGHTGTLDPQATGVLIVMLGKACKANPYLVHDTKEYRATLRLGAKFDTGDVWGKLVEEKTVPQLKTACVQEVFLSLLGKQSQTPPMYSAVKKEGRKLYEYARQNIQVTVEPREIEIFELELLAIEPEIEFRVVCSSGTYIRTLCETIAEKLNTVGAMASLVRTKVASVSLEDCCSLQEAIQQLPAPQSILPVLKQRYPVIEITDDQMEMDIRNGKKIILDAEDELVCLARNQQAIAMFEKTEEGYYRSKRGLW